MEQWVWALLGLVFFYLAITYWRYSNVPLRSFISRRKSEGSEMDAVTQEINEFQGYLNGLNSGIVRRYRIASVGFLIAAFSMLFGIYIA